MSWSFSDILLSSCDQYHIVIISAVYCMYMYMYVYCIMYYIPVLLLYTDVCTDLDVVTVMKMCG